MSPRKNTTFEVRCLQVYEFFMDFYCRNGLSPDFTEMSKGTKIRRGNLHKYVTHLINTDKLVKKADGPRGLLPAAAMGSYILPWPGHIAANSSDPLIQLDLLESDSTIEVPKQLLPLKVDFKSLYVLQVQGNSMTEANILNGDYVVIQNANSYQGNDIVVVLLMDQNAVTLKRLEPTERGSVKVKPESHQHLTRIEDPENILVQGRVVAVMRKC